ncbi:hypothetical protein FRC08_002817, partial [Ceratobasidium sp. 394]
MCADAGLASGHWVRRSLPGRAGCFQRELAHIRSQGGNVVTFMPMAQCEQQESSDRVFSAFGRTFEEAFNCSPPAPSLLFSGFETTTLLVDREPR